MSESEFECSHSRVTSAQDAVVVMRAMSNRTRLLLLCELASGEQTVGALEEKLGLGQAYVSQQLAHLREKGIVSATRDGRNMRYRVAHPSVRPILNTLMEQFCAD